MLRNGTNPWSPIRSDRTTASVASSLSASRHPSPWVASPERPELRRRARNGTGLSTGVSGTWRRASSRYQSPFDCSQSLTEKITESFRTFDLLSCDPDRLRPERPGRDDNYPITHAWLTMAGTNSTGTRADGAERGWSREPPRRMRRLYRRDKLARSHDEPRR